MTSFTISAADKKAALELIYTNDSPTPASGPIVGAGQVMQQFRQGIAEAQASGPTEPPKNTPLSAPSAFDGSKGQKRS